MTYATLKRAELTVNGQNSTRLVCRNFVCSPVFCMLLVDRVFQTNPFPWIWGNILNLTSDCVSRIFIWKTDFVNGFALLGLINVYQLPFWLSARYCRWALLIREWKNSFSPRQSILDASPDGNGQWRAVRQEKEEFIPTTVMVVT